MIQKREFLFDTGSIILAIVVALILGGVVFAIAGINPLDAYESVFYGALGSVRGISETIVVTIPLIFTGLAALFAFRCKLWNIGAEGQLMIGALAATLVALFINLPIYIHLPVIILAGFLAGGLWSAIAGVLKVKLGTNEILTTLMLNYIAIWLVHYAVYGPIRDVTAVIGKSYAFPPSAWYPILIPGTRLHAGLVLALLGAIFVYVVFKYTRLGYYIKIIGSDLRVAKYAGVNINKVILITMFISGGLAGLAGVGEVAGIHHFLQNGVYRISPDYGYIGIGVALLGGKNAWGTVLAAAFFAIFLNGTSFLKSTYGLHAHFVFFLVGLIVMSVLARQRLAEKLKLLFVFKAKD